MFHLFLAEVQKKWLKYLEINVSITTFVLYKLFTIKISHMDDHLITDELLYAWEETYKKGQLTFWVFLALKESRKCVEDIKVFVEKTSEGTMSCEEQSLYRNLRKFQHLGIVAYENKKVSKGPDRKYYYLTDEGNQLFKRFVERNIMIFTKDTIINLLNQ